MTSVRINQSGPAARPAKRRAFTLVELLVVIGIIALLISILLPALNSARTSAKLVKCASNLHNLGTALNVYASSNRGMLPYIQLRTPLFSTGNYLWDLEIPSRDALVRAGASRNSFFCPVGQPMNYDFTWTWTGDGTVDTDAKFANWQKNTRTTPEEQAKGVGVIGYLCLIKRPVRPDTGGSGYPVEAATGEYNRTWKYSTLR